MDRVYIAEIKISPAMAAKIQSKHGVSPQEVRDACQAPNRYRQASWHNDLERGDRLLVEGCTATGRLIKVILYPVDVPDGIYRLGTAFAGTRRAGGG